MADDESIHQSHDKLFKLGFGDPANTAAFIKAELPPEVSALVDWDQLRAEPGSFIDARFSAAHTDLLFSAPIAGHAGLVYLLFEHQTTPDPWLLLRMLRYMVCIWEKMTADHPGQPLPPILPVALVQNAVKWQLPARFHELLSLQEPAASILRPFVPDYTCRMLQLATMPYEQIPGTPAGILVLRVMKAERVGELLDAPVWDEALLGVVPREMLKIVLRYVLGADIDRRVFEHKVRSIKDVNARNTAMSLAQVYRMEGRQEGRQEDVIEALEVRFGVVPEGLREAVRAITDEANLKRLLRAAIQRATMEEFAQEL